jgi:hypothetical protein
MRKRSSKRLAGCIAIELALAAAGWSADFKAGAATAPTARALVVEDAKGNRAVFAQTEFRITQSLADFVASQLLRSQTLDRAALLFRWGGIGARPPQPDDLVAAITAAIGALEPATVRYGHRVLSVAAVEKDKCLGSLNEDGAVGTTGCSEGVDVTGIIRAAFQMVEPAHALLKRGEVARAFPVQAIALGKQVTVLALSGESALPEGLPPRGLIFSAFSNHDAPPPLQDARVHAAIQRVLARVK